LKRNKKKYLEMRIGPLLCLLLLLISCKKEIKNAEIKTDTIAKVAVELVIDSHNSQNSLDWTGTYRGITPCTDCEGIETLLVLNKDLTYTIKTKYLGKGDGKVFEEKGNFVWDKAGGIISLQGSKSGPLQYKVGENRLIQLDMEGKPITGALAEMFILKK
jgi:uncharacterized lipoprotein NlpE involved in copper resistance